MSTIIKVDHFTKKYGEFIAVDDVSFDVEEGSIFSFLGPNGAGKSTTINTLCTIFEKTSGTLLVDGKDVTKQKNAVREAIGVVFQDKTLDEKMTVEENIRMHCIFYNVPKNEINQRIDFVLEIVDLKDWKKKLISSLSGGMKRRIEIARALAHNPKVLFLDEPTTGLDPQTRASIWSYLIKLQKDKNITLFLTTHYMEEAEISDQVAVMDAGKIVAKGTPYELKKRYTKDTAYVTIKQDDAFEHALDAGNYVWKRKTGFYRIEVERISEFLRLIHPFNDLIVDMEIKKGTLNDVFLEITGKSIREDLS